MSTSKILTGGRAQKNLGKSKYPTELDKVIGGLLVPYTWSYSFALDATDDSITAGIKASLQASVANNAIASRSQLIGRFESFTDKSTEPTFETFGYGTVKKTDEGEYVMNFQYIEGGFEYHQHVRSYDGRTRQFKILLIGDKGNIVGTNVYTTDAQGNTVCTGIQGISMNQLDVQKFVLPNKDKSAGYMINIGLESVAEINDDACILATGANVFGWIEDAQVKDIQIVSKGTGAAGVYTVAVMTGDGKVNTAIGDGAIAWTAACFKVLRDSTGAAITITSIAVVGQDIAITCSTGDTDYLLGAKVRVSLQSVSAVNAIVGDNYESNICIMIDA